jgi:hypothetical protein
MTSIRFTRTGGFANIRLCTDVDDPDEVQQILHGLQDVAPQQDGPARDDFTYEFEVLDEGDEHGRPTAVSIPGSALPPPLRAMTRTLVDRAKPTR